MTVPPCGISTEFLSPVPCTYEDSLPDTILAPPVNVSPEADSNEPPGASVYCIGSSHFENGLLMA